MSTMMPTMRTSAAAAAGAMMESALAPPSSSSTDAYRHHAQLSLPLSPGQAMRRFAPGKSKTGRQSSKFGTVNYSVDEMRRLNEHVRAVMPIAGDDWLHVAYKFNYMRPESIPYREVESLKRKFKKMYCSRASAAASGKLPDYIDEAKELRRLINLRAERAQLDASDSQSEFDAQDATHGFEHPAPPHALVVSIPAAPVAALSAKTETAPLAPAANETVTAMAPTGSSSDDSQSSSERQLPPQDAASDVADPLPTNSAAEPLAAPPDAHAAAASVPQEPTGAVAAAAATSLAPLPSQDTPREPQSAPRVTSHDAHERVAPALSDAPSTSSVIAMLQQSIERKRRTIEDDVLSESERVRKERKKRKMEQVLLAIHHEQREREVLLSPMTSHPTVPSAATPTVLPSTDRFDATASVSVLETVLQFLVAQQREHAALLQQLRDERARERQLKSQRRREKERRRRREMRDLMRVMAAALGDAFPETLKHHLVSDASSGDEDTDSGDSDDPSAATPVVATDDSVRLSTGANRSTTTDADAQRIEASKTNAPSREALRVPSTDAAALL